MKKLRFSPLAVIALGCLLGAFLLKGCAAPSRLSANTSQQAPDYFTARFRTTRGDFVIESRRAWSPMAVDRLYQLIASGYYSDVAFFRVIPGFVAQFGIHNDSALYAYWNSRRVPDEPMLESNRRGTLSFARDSAGTRTAQLYINLADNTRLDTVLYQGVRGFPVVARVVSGMPVVDSLYQGYGRAIEDQQDTIARYGNTFLKNHYPLLDYIHSATISDQGDE